MMTARLLVVYESHTGNTRRMAEGVAQGAREVPEVEVVLANVGQASEAQLTEADGIILGAPTRNTKVPPAMSQFLDRMKQGPLRGKLGAVFGSYGWSGEAVGLLRSALVAQGVQVPGAGIRVKRTPDAEALEQCRQLGRSVGQRLVEEAR
ncbi:MAG: flavodoxin domain-containing protein [Anaerolineae bacterium]